MNPSTEENSTPSSIAECYCRHGVENDNTSTTLVSTASTETSEDDHQQTPISITQPDVPAFCLSNLQLSSTSARLFNINRQSTPITEVEEEFSEISTPENPDSQSDELNLSRLSRLSASGEKAVTNTQRSNTETRKLDLNQLVDIICKDEVPFESEVDLLNKVISWILTDDAQITLAPYLLSYVRFGLMTETDLLEFCQRDPISSCNISSVLRGVAYNRCVKQDIFKGIREFAPNPRIYLSQTKGIRFSICGLSPQCSFPKQAAEQEILSNLRESAAITIQRKFRTRRYELVCLLFTFAAAVIQSAWKSYRRQSKSCQRTEAATRIQSAWRGHVARKEMFVMHLAAIIIQARWRSVLCRERFLLIRDAVILIQSVWRGYQARKQLGVINPTYLILDCAHLQQNVEYIVDRRRCGGAEAEHSNCVCCNRSILILGGVNPLSEDKLGFGIFHYNYGKTNSWELWGHLPVKKYFSAATVVNGCLLISGGAAPTFNSSTLVPTKESFLFNISTKYWSPTTPMLRPRVWHSLHSINGIAYAIGGRTYNDVCEGSIECYNQNHQWTFVKTSMPRPRAGFASCIFREAIWVVGGIEENACLEKGVISDNTHYYDPLSNRWFPGPKLRSPRVFASLVTLEGRLYLIGGAVRSSIMNFASIRDVDELDIRDGHWKCVDQMATPRHHAASAVIDGCAYVIGGVYNNERHPLSNTEAFFIYDNEYKNIPDLPTALVGHAAVVIRN